jgi:hypothetical protein
VTYYLADTDAHKIIKFHVAHSLSCEGSSNNKVYRSRFSGHKFLKAPFGHYLLNIGCRENFIEAFKGRVSQYLAKLRKMISWAIRR